MDVDSRRGRLAGSARIAVPPGARSPVTDLRPGPLPVGCASPPMRTCSDAHFSGLAYAPGRFSAPQAILGAIRAPEKLPGPLRRCCRALWPSTRMEPRYMLRPSTRRFISEKQSLRGPAVSIRSIEWLHRTIWLDRAIASNLNASNLNAPNHPALNHGIAGPS